MVFFVYWCNSYIIFLLEEDCSLICFNVTFGTLVVTDIKCCMNFFLSKSNLSFFLYRQLYRFQKIEFNIGSFISQIIFIIRILRRIKFLFFNFIGLFFTGIVNLFDEKHNYFQEHWEKLMDCSKKQDECTDHASIVFYKQGLLSHHSTNCKAKMKKQRI